MTKKEAIKLISSELSINKEQAEKIIDKALQGGEIKNIDDYAEWTKNRLLPNCVCINKKEYSKMCINALKIVSATAPTDYGSSRQRDFGQLWADIIRGYLGEFAFKKFLKHNWYVASQLGHGKGKLEKYLPQDIHGIKYMQDRKFRLPKLKVGIKTTKWNGIWLDLPGGQFHHSDIHVLVKTGAGRDHLFAFFKEISVFKDKILKRGLIEEVITEKEANTMFASLPNFSPIPAYICGFVLKSDYSAGKYSYKGKMGIKHYTITSWEGEFKSKFLEQIKNKEAVPGNVKFQSIESFSHEKMFLFNAGALKWQKDDWEKVISRL